MTRRRKSILTMVTALVLFVSALGFVASGCAGNNNAYKPVTPVTPGGETDNREKGVSSVTIGNIRVQILSDTLVRVEEKGKAGFEDRETYLIQNRDNWYKTEYTQTTADGKDVIRTSAYDVYIEDSGASISDVVVQDKNGDIIWQYTGKTSSNVYLPSPSDELRSWYFSDSPRIIPSADGYSPNNAVLQGWDFNNDAPDFYIFMPQGAYKTFTKDYISLTGQSEMVSLQMLGYWDSRWYAYSDETALQQIIDYRDKGYSIDVLVIDTDWRNSSSTGGVGYDINTDLFPNMAAFLEQCHALGVNVIFNDHPEPVGGTQNGLDSAEVGFRNEKLTMLLSMGLDYWWYDRNWSVALNSADPDISVFAFGMYAYQWITNDYLQSITDIGEYAERALIMGNVDGCLHGKWNYASDISAHRYSIQWTGDIGSNSDALAQEIYASVFGGAEVGLPYMSSDIGGHTQPVSDEQYVRWAEYGALSTIMRVHCTSADYIGQVGRMPWLFGETAEEVMHKYVDMRYNLLPLYYALARENYDTGLPIMRRLDIEYPQYVEAARNDQYLLGDNILIAPIAESEVMNKVPETWLSHTSNGTKVSGLKAEYFSNATLSGTPAYTTVDKNVYFDWGNNSPTGISPDNFSVRWTGEFTVGDKDAMLRFFADDGIMVYIDGVLEVNAWTVYDQLFTTRKYAAGSTHTIEIRYFEGGGGAHVYMYATELEENGMPEMTSRTVFIPDGTWIDVWTGERYTGPQTITVAHGLTTSPIFVREGAVLALAQNMQSTSEKDWSKMGLDIYPGLTSTATTLYEDDTQSQAYKDGHYRTTEITQTYDAQSKKYIVTINPAEGSFTGDRAFDSREWTVRIHAREEWGRATLTLNGKRVESSLFQKDSTARPFSYTGAAADSRILTFTTPDIPVNRKVVIEISFAGDYVGVAAPEYDRTEIGFDLTYGDVGNKLDLTEAGTVDWAYFGADGTLDTVRKDTETHLIGTPSSYDMNWSFTDAMTETNWTDGDLISRGEFNTSGIVSQKDFAVTLQTNGDELYYVIYASGYRCTAKVTVRDRAGNVKTVTFGNMEGNFSQRVVIHVEGEAVGELYFTYAVVSSKPNGTGSASNVALSAMYVSETLPEIENAEPAEVTVTQVSVESPNATTNLSEADVIDWVKTGSEGGGRVEMSGSDYIGAVSFDGGGQGFTDYTSSVSWNNGQQVASNSGTTNGTCTTGSVRITVTVDQTVDGITLYTGAWRATGTVYVYDAAGTLLMQSSSFTGGDVSATRAVNMSVNAAGRTRLTIVISPSNKTPEGNVSLSAMTVKGK